ncbi:MAG: CotD family spore coat protein [Bacillaceae bacterium]
MFGQTPYGFGPGYGPGAVAPYGPGMGYGPGAVAPYGPGPHMTGPVTYAQPVVHPTQYLENHTYHTTIVPHVFPSHLNTVNHNIIQCEASYPHTQSQCNVVTDMCHGPGPNVAPANIGPTLKGQQMAPTNVSPTMKGQQMAPTMKGQQMAPTMKGQQMAPTMKGQQMAPTHVSPIGKGSYYM